MKYRIGWPGWKFAYKLGFTMTYKVSFEYSLADDEFQNEEEICIHILDILMI
ncbi:Uncharacterised protein [Anaerobiospirillum thomasii]|uniref:hypothetical protein n=1 Tax=Anaerobiospirillum thomasii TaxID=179995 RepID=UPI000D837540|nr:hypothetical protein [Anaerobiospirillum thomasii]SPT67595.1 Uncharacterised protein [Anaerobiospirillum thomasii]